MKVSDMSLIGNKALGFTQYAQIADYEFDPGKCDPIPDDERKSSTDLLLDEIFAVNPLTKLPDGDIACFVNENTSESVRQYILANLVKDNGEKSDTSGYDGISDDDIAEFTRGIDESVSSYRDRIVSVLRRRSDG